MHVDERDDLTWTCEAFGIPDVEYEWLKNAEPIAKSDDKLAPEDRGRYEIRDNVLIIRGVSILELQWYFCKLFCSVMTDATL